MFTLYTKENCPLCESAKQFLQTNNIVYEEFTVGKNITRDEVLKKFPDATVVPIIVMENGSQMSFHIIQNWMEQQKLKRSVR